MPTLSTKPKKPPLYGKWIIMIGLTTTGAFLGYWLLKPKDTPPDYLTAQAQIGDIENTVMASGKVKPAQSVNVGASVSGTITKLYVQVGDEVKKGDLIAQISQIEQKNNVANAQATLDQAKASLAQAQSTLLSSQGNVTSANATLNARISELAKAQQHFERLQGLLTIDAISRQDYDDAAASLQIAKANVQVAKTALQNASNEVTSAMAAINSQQATISKANNDLNTAQEDLKDTTIVAPIDGTVVSVSQKQGTTVNANQSAPTIVTLADLSRVRINAQISEADVIYVSSGMKARFNVIGNPDIQYDATLAGIEPAPEKISDTSSADSAVYYVGYLDVDNDERKFRIDMTAQINIITESVKNVLTIPSAALQNEQGKYRVRVIGSDGFAKPIPVTIGLNNRVNVEIKSGLKAGDTVVIGEATNSKPSKPNNRNRPPML